MISIYTKQKQTPIWEFKIPNMVSVKYVYLIERVRMGLVGCTPGGIVG